ncbi:helix-turn-helix domain-containing protein [Limosilactobacillus ingluviei]|uniref:helix-turn-helix domain-containing protein n=1 Tax=Limosilactobacillus ingluviei TaxID=148604 RepID=UPI0023F35B8E|nr:helix-turn-helix transcriptional regulator [Limosilactobacillus ingluviei]
MKKESLNIGQAIRFFRKQEHVTQEKLAEDSGLSVKFISLLESNEKSNISIQNLANIAHALHLDLATLTSQIETNVPEPSLPSSSRQLIQALATLPEETANRLSKSFLTILQTFQAQDK